MKTNFIVKKKDIDSISSIEVNGITHHLGECRSFRNHEQLNKFMPESGRYSLSWTKLNKNETLDLHEHPTKSMIIITGGNGVLHSKDNLVQEVREGDVICIPERELHGFSTEHYLNGISVQFEGNGLYEDTCKPRVEFTNDYFDLLNSYHEKRLKKHINLPFFNLLSNGILNDAHYFNRFIECLQQWSACFQSIMHLRQATTKQDVFKKIFGAHFKDEFGHDDILSSSFSINNKKTHSFIDVSSAWFKFEMLTSSDLDKMVIVHHVLERSAHAFHSEAINNPLCNSKYFSIHAESDEEHHEMGRELTYLINRNNYEHLMDVSEKSWDILELMLQNMHEYIMMEGGN
ncbi:hypothetical protein QCD58_004927 [Enterobacter hormaechei]|nr:hypothetical protein [Enterobacter hormaechei]